MRTLEIEILTDTGMYPSFRTATALSFLLFPPTLTPFDDFAIITLYLRWFIGF